MNVPCVIQLGVSGPESSLGFVSLGVNSVGAASSWSGSCHILSMGRHYDDYVVTGRVLTFPPIVGFPVANPYLRLAAKSRSASVTGNVGESVAAIVARSKFHVRIRDIVHLQPSSQIKSPDFIMRFGHLFPAVFAAVCPDLPGRVLPECWPVESKARKTAKSAQGARREALKQLIAYWAEVGHSHPAAVGYGLVVTFTYSAPREVRVNLFVPSRPTLLRAVLRLAGGSARVSCVMRCLSER